jgi:hypothetical protein
MKVFSFLTCANIEQKVGQLYFDIRARAERGREQKELSFSFSEMHWIGEMYNRKACAIKSESKMRGKGIGLIRVLLKQKLKERK